MLVKVKGLLVFVSKIKMAVVNGYGVIMKFFEELRYNNENTSKYTQKYIEVMLQNI